MRAFRLLRRFSEKLPKVPDFAQEELNAREKVHEERIEHEREELERFIPNDYKDGLIKTETPELPSIFGKSDEEDTKAFFLEDTKDVQYIYAPGKILEFDESGHALIFQSSSRIFWPEKLKYCWKIILPVMFSVGVTIQPFAYSTAYILFSWTIPLFILSRCLLVDKIFLTQDGKQVKVHYRRFKFLPRTKTLNIDSFKEPTGDAFIMWSLYELPDDLKTYNESSSLEKLGFAKWISWWSFLLLPKRPELVNREVLINAFNGIFIDCQQQGKSEIEQRYFVLHKKNEVKK